jgi:erythromycin esterase
LHQTNAMEITLDDWMRREAIAFDLERRESFDAAVDRLVAALSDSVELLGIGEALHGDERYLILRNRLFERLVTAHGYTAIAVESSFPRGRLANEYVAGRGGESFDAVMERGFSHGFGRSAANRELIEWMRTYNADPDHRVQLHFYGFDSPTEYGPTDSPRQVLYFVLDYVKSIDRDCAQACRERIDPLIGQDADWENPAAIMDPTKSNGLTPAAAALRIETEDLISELSIRRPELVAKSDAHSYLEALHYASVARQLLNYHAALARPSSDRHAICLGMRDAMMAENLAYIVSRERGRGKVLCFAHNMHLKLGQAQWQLGPNVAAWWPAGVQVDQMLNDRYAVIGAAVGVSEAHGIGAPEPGTLEARLAAMPGPAQLIPTHRSQGLATAEIAALPTRTGSTKNMSYFPLTAQSLTDFDWLLMLD